MSFLMYLNNVIQNNQLVGLNFSKTNNAKTIIQDSQQMLKFYLINIIKSQQE